MGSGITGPTTARERPKARAEEQDPATFPGQAPELAGATTEVGGPLDLDRGTDSKARSSQQNVLTVVTSKPGGPTVRAGDDKQPAPATVMVSAAFGRELAEIGIPHTRGERTAPGPTREWTLPFRFLELFGDSARARTLRWALLGGLVAASLLGAAYVLYPGTTIDLAPALADDSAEAAFDGPDDPGATSSAGEVRPTPGKQSTQERAPSGQSPEKESPQHATEKHHKPKVEKKEAAKKVAASDAPSPRAEKKEAAKKVAAAEAKKVAAAEVPASRPHAAEKGPEPKGSTGELTLVTEPWAKVSYKGKELGITPLFSTQLPAGRQTLKLTSPEGRVFMLPVNIQEGSPTSMRVSLRSLVAE